MVEGRVRNQRWLFIAAMAARAVQVPTMGSYIGDPLVHFVDDLPRGLEVKSPSSTSKTPIPSDNDMTRTYEKNNRRTTTVGDVGCKGMFLIMASSTASVTSATLP